MAKFRKKPVVVEAILYDRSSASIDRILDTFGTEGFNNSPIGLYILTDEGTIRADKGDWIIQDVNKECYPCPCKPDIFKKTYELVEN